MKAQLLAEGKAWQYFVCDEKMNNGWCFAKV